MAIARENEQPADPAAGRVWSAILHQVDQPGSQSEFVSVADSGREAFCKHPWSIGGGGAAELKELLDEHVDTTLGSVVEAVGPMLLTLLDEAFVAPRRTWDRLGIAHKVYVTGDSVRDWTIAEGDVIVFPYDDNYSPVSLDSSARAYSHFWRVRTDLSQRIFFGKTSDQVGLRCYEYRHVERTRATTLPLLAFACVATHNSFALLRTSVAANRHAPVIKLAASASLEEHLGLLGLLNSSTGAFWLRQVCHDKGGGGIGGGIAAESWERFLEFTATHLQRFPLPNGRPVAIASVLDALAAKYSGSLPTGVVRTAIPSVEALESAHLKARQLRQQMIAAQEELDWQGYGFYGLLPEPPVADLLALPPIILGQRAFEIVLARRMAAGEEQTTWFERHGSTPITQIPEHWPEDYKQVVRRRIEIIESDKNIALIERPEYKRRWNTEPWEQMQERALRPWLLDRLEGWPGGEDAGMRGRGDAETKATPRSLIWDEAEPRLMSVAQLADRVRQDRDFIHVGTLYRGREDFDVTKLVAELVEDEAVPFLPVLRYKESGLRNRRVWEQVWDLQRQEDAIDARTKLPPTDPQHLTEQQAKAEKKAKVGDIPVPPKYKSTDMLNGTIWRLRGKLDVPKERFVSFHHCQRDSDPTLVITWAGYDHLQQMQALAAYYMEMKEKEGWPPERRVPLLAGMLELLPWVLQWHNEIHPDFGVGMGDYYRDFINDEAREVGKTVEEVQAWVSSRRTRQRR